MRADNVVDFGGVTYLDLEPDRVFEKAIGNVDSVVIIGFDKEGDFYFASSKADAGEVIWLMEMAKKKLLEVDI
jgi:hypothetical protein